jgi:hypothetical protein
MAELGITRSSTTRESGVSIVTTALSELGHFFEEKTVTGFYDNSKPAHDLNEGLQELRESEGRQFIRDLCAGKLQEMHKFLDDHELMLGAASD